MGHAAVLPQVEIPAVALRVQVVVADGLQELVVVILALGPSDDLAVALRCEEVGAFDVVGLLRMLFHVEGLHLLRIVLDEHRLVVEARDDGFVVAAQVHAPLDVGAPLLENAQRLVITDAVERGDDLLQGLDIPFERGQLFGTLGDSVLHDI